MRLPTVAVKADNELGYVLINECDLTDKHVLFKSNDKIQDADNDGDKTRKRSASKKTAARKTIGS